MPNKDGQVKQRNSKQIAKQEQRAEPTTAQDNEMVRTNVLQLRHGLPGERARGGNSPGREEEQERKKKRQESATNHAARTTAQKSGKLTASPTGTDKRRFLGL